MLVRMIIKNKDQIMSLSKLGRDDTYRNISETNLHGWETTLHKIRTNEDFIDVEITPQMADMFIGDFHGLLLRLGVFPQFLHIHTRLNGMTSSDEFEGKSFVIRVIHEDVLSSLTNVVAPKGITNIV